MKYLILFTALVFCTSVFSATKKDQKKAVLLKKIAVQYDGETKKGLAHGQGKALGEEDSYEGTFRKGYPHGEGVYIWGNGNKYTGEYSKGKRDGKGELRIKRGDNLPDSIQVGYFKDNEYVGIYKTPYKIFSDGGTRNIEFQKVLNSFSQVSIEVYANGKNVGINTQDKNNTLVERISGVSTLTNATYPMERIEVSFSVDRVSYKVVFDIYEKGNWKVIINV